MGANEDLKLMLTTHMQSFASNLLELLIDRRQPAPGAAKPSDTISANCRSQLVHLSSSALKNELWALKVFDSSGRLRSGTSSGSLRNAIGDYDQCLSQTPEAAPMAALNFTGSRYCLAQLDLSQELGQLSVLGARDGGQVAHLGLCVPAKCRPVEIVRLANRLLGSRSRLSVHKIDCSSPVSSIWSDWLALVSLLVLVALVGACALATWLDRPRQTRRRATLVEAFSLPRSLGQLTERWNSAALGGRPFNSAMLDALRVLSMCWIIVMHTYSFSLQWIFFDNNREVGDIYKSLWTQWIGNGTFAVDNFYLISGMLAWLRNTNSLQTGQQLALAKRKLSNESAHSSQPSMRELGESRRLAPAELLANLRDRYLRLAPATLLAILVSVAWLPRLARGPGSDSASEMFTDWCKPNWPLNLLMVQNLFATQRMCFGHTWYLAVDLQLFAMLQLVLLSVRSVRARRRALVCALVLAQAAVAAQVFFGRLPSMPLVPADSLAPINNYFGQLYIKPHYWLASYSLGCLLASYLGDWSAGKLEWSGKQALAAQLLSLSWMSLLVLSSYPYFTKLVRLSVLQSTLLAFLSRPLWSACTCCLLYFTLFGERRSAQVGWLAATLSRLSTSLAVLPALARLTFGAYLLHLPIMLVIYANLHQTFRFSHTLLLHFCLANIVLSYSAALLLYLLVERPILATINRLWRASGESKGVQFDISPQ